MKRETGRLQCLSTIEISDKAARQPLEQCFFLSGIQDTFFLVGILKKARKKTKILRNGSHEGSSNGSCGRSASNHCIVRISIEEIRKVGRKEPAGHETEISEAAEKD